MVSLIFHSGFGLDKALQTLKKCTIMPQNMRLQGHKMLLVPLLNLTKGHFGSCTFALIVNVKKLRHRRGTA